jgi:hypothetical protein
MKIIDEKGRLFGRINLIDFIVLVSLFSFIPFVYLGYNIISRRNMAVEAPKVFTELELYCKLIKVDPQIIKLIAVGDKEIDESGATIGELNWVGEGKPYGYKLDIGAKEPITKEDLELKEVLVRLKIKTNIKGNSLYYKDKLIAINSPFNFVTSKYAIEVILIKQEEINLEIGRIEIELSCRLVKIDPQILKLIAVGDKEIDKDGTVIGELTWVSETWAGASKKDLELKEVLVRLKIKTNIKGSSLYYKDKLIAINSPFNFVTSKYAIEVILTKEEEIKKIKQIERKVRIVETTKIDLNVIFNNLTDDTIRLIDLGDKQLDDKGEMIAEILDIGKIESNMINIDLGNNNFINVEDKGKKRLGVKMRLMADIDEEKNLYFNNEYVAYNLPIKFKTNKYIIEGIVAHAIAKQRWVKAEVRFSSILPEIASLIKEGDIEKDATGSTLAILKKTIVNEASKIQTLVVQERKFITLSSPFQRDIIATLGLLCEERNTGLFFEDYPIRVGNVVVFTTDLYSISGNIINLDVQ